VREKRKGDNVTQNDLFSNPIARKNDPGTSKRAAQRHTRSGERATQALRVLQVLKEHPGLTSRELAKVSGIAHEVMHKRLPDLRRNGLARKEGTKKCTVTEHTAARWYAA
jgi:predicted HTH transcriptional regulator